MTKQFNPKTDGRGIELTNETRNASGGCLHNCKWKMPNGIVARCYAKGLAERTVAKNVYLHGFGHYYRRPDEHQAPAADETPRLIFSDSMSDMLATNDPDQSVHDAPLDPICGAAHHTYQPLINVAQHQLKHTTRVPPNLWVGVSSGPEWFTESGSAEHSRRRSSSRARRFLPRCSAAPATSSG